MTIVQVMLASDLGAVLVRVASPDHPHMVAGRVWRYHADTSNEGSAGVFTSDNPDVMLGSPNQIAGKLFLVQGAVLHQNDDPPAPYKVVITIVQDGKVLHQGTPAQNGEGAIGSQNVPFVYRFTLGWL